jgi:hypothetical protein
MTTHAIPATHLAASIPSIPPCPRPASALDDGDVSVTTTFRPCSSIGSTEVVTSLDALDDAALLALLDVTISRLTAYRAAYQQAMTEDAAPAPAPVLPRPLPVPWHAW